MCFLRGEATVTKRIEKHQQQDKRHTTRLEALRQETILSFSRFIPMILAEGSVWIMARVTGLEPATSGVTGRRSNQLSYTPIIHKRSMNHI